MNNQPHTPTRFVDVSTLPQMNGRAVATAKQLAALSGRAQSQVYATVRAGHVRKIEGTTLLDATDYFEHMRTRKMGRPFGSDPKPQSEPDAPTKQ